MSTIVGIDLGTTNSLVACMKGDRPEIIPNEQGKRLTPSVVGLDKNGKLHVGETAKNQLIAMPEPTAAALAYGLDHLDKEQYILVYDLGGGTFDVSVLEMFEGVLDVKASAGNNALGGSDFDRCIVDFLVQQFQRDHGVDLSKDTRA